MRRGAQQARLRALAAAHLGELRKPPQAATLRVRGEGQPPRRKRRSRPLPQARHGVRAAEPRAMWRSRTNATSQPPHALSRGTPRPDVRLALALGDVGHSATSGAMQSCSYAERTEACKS